MLFRLFHKQTGMAAIRDTRELLEELPPAFKTYRRFPQIALPSPRSIDASFQHLLEKRESRRDFDQHTAIPLTVLSDILYTGQGVHTGRIIEHHRARFYPSGGALYPLETYVAAFRVEDLETGLYHFSPETHALERLIHAKAPEAILSACSDVVPGERPAAIIITTALWNRAYPKYGEFAYRMALIEAGHMTQNMALAATALSLKLCPTAGFRTKIISDALALSDDAEDVLYLSFLGR